MTNPNRSALFPRFTAAVLAGVVASTAGLPAALAAPPAAAAAKKPDQKTRDAARKAYTEATEAFGKGDFESAAKGYTQANELIPSPQAAYWIAKSLDKAGKSEEAAAAYQKFLDDPGVASAGEDKVNEAKTRVGELSNRPAEVNLSTTPAGAAVAVDGQPQMGETPMVVKVPPGAHTIQITADGYDPQKLELTVKAGEKLDQKVELKLAADVPAPAPAPAPTPPPEEAAPKRESKPKSKLPAYITLGVAGAGAIVGTIFGVKAMSSKKDFDDTPTNDNADTVERNALIADMAFGVAITLGVTGIVLLTTSGSSDSADAATAARKLPKRATLNVAPYVSPYGGGAAARVTF